MLSTIYIFILYYISVAIWAQALKHLNYSTPYQSISPYPSCPPSPRTPGFQHSTRCAPNHSHNSPSRNTPSIEVFLDGIEMMMTPTSTCRTSSEPNPALSRCLSPKNDHEIDETAALRSLGPPSGGVYVCGHEALSPQWRYSSLPGLLSEVSQNF